MGLPSPISRLFHVKIKLCGVFYSRKLAFNKNRLFLVKWLLLNMVFNMLNTAVHPT